ncbi:hypothetical protein QLX67_10470 [Balneolaceae bacterium ANBcel3]|nr:hypothetical protein [Balneolaceae bacterium ANBcel3]
MNITAIKKHLSANWHAMRIVVLLSGIFLLIHSMLYGSGATLLLGLFFLLQALTNTGCLVGACYGGQCEINSGTSDNDAAKS